MKLTTRDMTQISLFTVLSIIGAKVSLPVLTVPFTLQFIISLLTGIVLGARRALMAQGLYLLMGLIGLPVFAKGGGPAYLLEPTFGYIVGMALASGLVGLAADRLDPQRSGLKPGRILAFNFLGLLIVYATGLCDLYLILHGVAGQALPFLRLLQIGLWPFLINDSLYCLAAAWLGPRLRRLAPC
jgi:biotin transport system substrate-specific component